MSQSAPPGSSLILCRRQACTTLIYSNSLLPASIRRSIGHSDSPKLRSRFTDAHESLWSPIVRRNTQSVRDSYALPAFEPDTRPQFTRSAMIRIPLAISLFTTARRKSAHGSLHLPFASRSRFVCSRAASPPVRTVRGTFGPSLLDLAMRRPGIEPDARPHFVRSAVIRFPVFVRLQARSLRRPGIEPGLLAWEANVLPLDQRRSLCSPRGSQFR